MALPPVRASRLSPEARAVIRDWRPDMTVAGFVRWCFPDGHWVGDSCGCTDDRCRDGFHHSPGEECGCLRASLERYERDAFGPPWSLFSTLGA